MIANSFEDLPKVSFALSIGMFDGVHLGHQTLIREMKKTNAFTLILTFSNHPAEILRPSPPRLILPTETKLRMLSQLVDWVLVLPFTQETANTPFEELLDHLSLSHLFLGKGDAFGKDRLGNEENLKAYCLMRNIELKLVEKTGCSSTLIRKAIESENFDEASQLLGYPYPLQKGGIPIYTGSTSRN